mgnify:CR=1 FL=1
MSNAFELNGRLRFDGHSVFVQGDNGVSVSVGVDKPNALRLLLGQLMIDSATRMQSTAEELLGQKAGDR